MSDNEIFWDRMWDKICELDSSTDYYSTVEDFTGVWGNEWGIPRLSTDLILSILSHLWDESGKKSLFNEFRNFEPILQRDEKYRDHFIHSLNVFLMGYYILNKLCSNEELNRIFRRSNSPNLTWMLASTFHDIAYPLQNIDFWINDVLSIFIGINPHISISITNLMPPIYDHFIQQISKENSAPLHGLSDSSENSIDWKFYNLLNEKMYEKDHGVYSGLILAHKLAIREGFYERSGLYGDFPINHLPACHAICCHSLDCAISFNKHPYAFLLKLCDEIQDWGRPSKLDDREVITLRNIEIIMNSKPILNISLNITEEREKKLKVNLSPILMITDDKLQIKFINQKRNIFHELI